MKLFPYLMIGLGGGLGSMARYWLIQISEKYLHKDSQVGILLANIIGCVLIGFFFALFDKYSNTQMRLFIMVGLLGGMTTFSTFILDIYKLWTTKGALNTAIYIGISTVVSLAGFLISYKLTIRFIG